MFREGIGVVVEGTFARSDQVFKTNRLMVNHCNEYRAPTTAECPRGVEQASPVTQARSDTGA